MDPRLLYIAIAVVLDGLVGLAGGLLPESWLARNITALVSFAAGAIVGAFFMDLMPEAVEKLGQPAFALAMAGFLGTALLEWRVGHHHGTSEALPWSLLAADALHNMGDGAAIAAAFLTSTEAGVATAAAVMFHELPQEVGDYAILRRVGWSKGRALAGLVAVQFSAALGAALLWVAAAHIARASSYAVAVAAGGFLYVGASDLLPELRQMEEAGRGGRAAGFLLGLAAMAALRLI